MGIATPVETIMNHQTKGIQPGRIFSKNDGRTIVHSYGMKGEPPNPTSFHKQNLIKDYKGKLKL